jgi:hypothetical protein
MKYNEIRKKAIRLDKFIDMNRTTMNLPMREVIAIVKYLFPSCYKKSKGWYKTVFTICPQRGSKGEVLILKVGKERSIKNDLTVYRMLPRKLREKFFAKIHWHTKYCLLQEWGENIRTTKRDLERLKQLAFRYGLVDIKRANIRKVNGSMKIIDATILLKGRNRKIRETMDYLRIRFS